MCSWYSLHYNWPPNCDLLLNSSLLELIYFLNVLHFEVPILPVKVPGRKHGQMRYHIILRSCHIFLTITFDPRHIFKGTKTAFYPLSFLCQLLVTQTFHINNSCQGFFQLLNKSSGLFQMKIYGGLWRQSTIFLWGWWGLVVFQSSEWLSFVKM